MADYAPPPGPPPPKVPEGWKAVYNQQYSEWFYVNIYTKKSQWDKPTEPVYPSNEHPPEGPPPAYAGAQPNLAPGEKTTSGSRNTNMDEDERLARQLQEEEEARARAHQPSKGAADTYYQDTPQGTPLGGGSYAPDTSTAYGRSSGSSSKSGLFGKLLGKVGGSHSRPQQQYGYGQQGYLPPQGPPMGYYGGGGYPQAYGRRPGGGLGTGGAAALGVGGGLLGGMMLGEMAADAGDGGGDYGGDGGDFGGGDFGGGDFGGGD